VLDKLKDGDIVITSSLMKKNILKSISCNKRLLNIKIYSKKEFLNLYYGTPSLEAFYFLIKHYNYKYSIAKEILENIFIPRPDLIEIRHILDSNNLITYYNLSIKRIVIIDIYLDNYILDSLSKYEVINLSSTEGSIKHQVNHFDKEIDEVVFVASRVRELINKGVLINKIYLVNVASTYYLDIDRIFKFFKIPINLYTSKNIYNILEVKNFLNTYKDNDIEVSLDTIKDINIKNTIINILNKYSFIEDKSYLIDILSNELKNTKIPIDTLDMSVNLINIEDINSNDNYYFLMNFNQGSIPREYRDDLLIKDKDRSKYKMFTSIDNLNNEINLIKMKLSNTKNITISYKDRDTFNTYYPSILISDLNYEVINPKIDIYKYSDTFNKLCLCKYLDNYIKYNEYNIDIDKLYTTYKDISYNTYDNRFIKIDFNDLYDYLDGKVNLSYSSISNYYLCKFRFFINNILKLDPFSDTFLAFIGSLFHDSLSKMYNDNFNLHDNYYNYLKKRNLTNKEKFYCDKLYTNLESIIKVIKYQESLSNYNNTLTEKYISIEKTSKLKVTFLGFIDKIKYIESDGKVFVSIIDYKTGYVPTTLDNINYGMHLQLPVYIYLAKNGLKKNVKITGFYLQKILSNPTVDCLDTNKELHNNLKLDGYTIDREEEIINFDKTYSKSEVIKGMSITKDGFSKFAKVIKESDIDKITDIVDDKINEVITSIEEGDFSINPKRIDNELVGCTYCHYRELCYRKEEDIIDLENKTKDDILGGEE